MLNSHETLGLGPNASDTEIRARYLQLVREFPPDRDPERFAEIRAAYDDLRDPLAQLSRRLFSLGTADTFDALAADLRARLQDPRLPSAVLLSLAESK